MNIERVLEKVEQIGVYMYPIMDNESLEDIVYLLRQYKDISYFIINNKDTLERRLCVKKRVKETVDTKELYNGAVSYYKSGNYDKALELNLRMFYALYSKPKEYPMIAIGMCYLKLGNIEAAISYLEIATVMSLSKNTKFDFTELVNRLKGKKQEINSTLEEDRKPYFEFGEKDYRDSELFVRGLDQVISLINNNYGIKEACGMLNLSYQEYLTVLLILAREYYYIGDYIQGDRLFNIVKKDKNRDRKINVWLSEIEKNKKFYQFRKSDTQIMTLKHNYLV